MRQELRRASLIQALRSADPKVRTDAWLRANEVGAPAVVPLASLVVSGELETSRAAKRGLWKIVRTVGAPDSAGQKSQVLAALITVLQTRKEPIILREVLWMLSEIAGGETCDAIGPFLSDPGLREDARCVLERIPGSESLAMLKGALEKAPEDFKMNIVQSLRARGVEVPGYPCQKLVPTG
jgi:hypothetical protein